MASPSYNGWSGLVRDTRSVWSFRLSDKRLKPRAQEQDCEMCGADYRTSGHAEEYGPAFSDYILGTHALCYRCHGMLHLRFKFPNRFNRYLDQIFNHGPAPEIDSLRTVFGMANGKQDIGDYPRPEGDHWALQLTLDRPKEKDPTRAFECQETGKIYICYDYYLEASPDIFWLYPHLFPYNPRKVAPRYYQQAAHQCPGMEVYQIFDSLDHYKQSNQFEARYAQRLAASNR